jgi:hypothetical protein
MTAKGNNEGGLLFNRKSFIPVRILTFGKLFLASLIGQVCNSTYCKKICVIMKQHPKNNSTNVCCKKVENPLSKFPLAKMAICKCLIHYVVAP